MRGAFTLLAAASVVATASGRSLITANPLANANLMADAGGRHLYNYLEDVSGYKLEFGRCHRVKVHENNDDDGGQNMYNGRYHAQTQRFASFFLCSEASDGTCSSCDYSTEYVTDLDTYLESTVTYVQNYCASCAACGRRLEDEEDEDENEAQDGGYDVDCYTCKDQCELYSNGGNQESNYLDCEEAYVDDEGNQLYSAPTCDSDGDIVIDMFYDDECLVKHSVGNYYGLEYSTFLTIQQSCIDCNDANGMCYDLYEESFHCESGNNYNEGAEEDEDVSVCKSFKEASINRTYNEAKKGAFWVPIVIFALLVGGCFIMGSYTYYVRHRPKTPLATLDHGDGTSSGLPAIS